MKWWCVGLLVINVLYFGFEYNRHLRQAVAEGGGAAPLPEGAATLTLLREHPEPPPLIDQPAELGDPAPAATAPAEPPAPAVVEQTPPEPKPQAGAAEPGAAKPEKASPPAIQWACASIGAFPSAAEADQIRQRFAGPDTKVLERTEQEVSAKRYWVYLDTQGSEEVARTRLAELAAKGVEDFLLSRTGEPKNAISLGLYSTPASVTARVSALERQGFRPLVQERHRTREVYWLDIAAPAEALAQAQAAFPPEGPKLVSVGCDTVAFGSPPP